MTQDKINLRGNLKDFPKVGSSALVFINLSKAKALKVNRKKKIKKICKLITYLKSMIRFKSLRRKSRIMVKSPLKKGIKDNLLENL
jgi:hypothetical protein